MVPSIPGLFPLGWQRVPGESHPIAKLRLAPGESENVLGAVKLKGCNLEKPGQNFLIRGSEVGKM